MSLLDLKIKIDWARQHLYSLNATHDLFVQSSPNTITATDGLEDGEYILALKTSDPPLRSH